MHAYWTLGLPHLHGPRVLLRDLTQQDARSLFTMLTGEDVRRFISPPPSTEAAMGRFIAWAIDQRASGRYACFAVAPANFGQAAGIIQIREREPGSTVAEWGFAIAPEFWGAGVFEDAAELAMGFAFEAMNVHRLEARACVVNGRGNGALRKIGAVAELVAHHAFPRDGGWLDQRIWSVLKEEWLEKRSRLTAQVEGALTGLSAPGTAA